MRFIYLVALVLPQFSAALETMNCPQEMTISFEVFQEYDNEDLRNFSEASGFNWQTDSAKIRALRDSFKDVQPQKDLKFALKNRRTGNCEYALLGTNSIRAAIFNRWDHKDLLKVAIEKNGQLFWASFPLLRVLPQGIKLRLSRA